MTRVLVVLRPEPGASATAARARALGHDAVVIPLFAVSPVAWAPPDPNEHDALLLTSANAARLAGGGLADLTGLPTFAVGDRTADAAREAGLDVVATGIAGGADLARDAHARGVRRALWLCGRDRDPDLGPPVSRAIIVYASDSLPIDRSQLDRIRGGVALLHSPRAAAHFAALTGRLGLARGDFRIAALSEAVARAAGDGWAAIAVAALPTDTALLAAATRLSD